MLSAVQTAGTNEFLLQIRHLTSLQKRASLNETGEKDGGDKGRPLYRPYRRAAIYVFHWWLGFCMDDIGHKKYLPKPILPL